MHRSKKVSLALSAVILLLLISLSSVCVVAIQIAAEEYKSTESIIDLDTTNEEDVVVSTTSTNSQEEKTTTIEDQYKELLTETRHEHQGDDELPDGMLLPLSRDPDCVDDNNDNTDSCFAPPQSTIETMTQQVCDDDTDEGTDDVCTVKDVEVDKHWGSDKRILAMRDKLRKAGSGMYDISEEDTDTNEDDDAASGEDDTTTSDDTNDQKQKQQKDQKQHRKNQNQQHPFDANNRPPIFLMPGLAATRLVSWKHKSCPHSALLSDIKFNDYVWLNMKLLIQMGTIAVQCWEECMTLGRNQTDSDLGPRGCKLRPDEGLDAIASLAPGSVGAELLVGQTNTLFAWLVQWLADNLGYDLSNIIGLPYDWRLSPHMMEKRDGFLSQTRRRMEAAVKANGGVPGIMLAHSMGNSVFRYFLVWLRHEMRDEAYQRIVASAERRAKRNMQQQAQSQAQQTFLQQQGWMSGVASGFDDLWHTYFAGNDGDGGHGTTNTNNPHHHHTSTKTGSSGSGGSSSDYDSSDKSNTMTRQFWELAKLEGDQSYFEWVEGHIWTYVGLSAPILGAINPLRSVISGENMGLPFSDEIARRLELSFGCTNTVNPISAKMAFCDNWASGQFPNDQESELRADLFCLDSLVREIEESTDEEDPWTSFPQLEQLLKKRVDWDTDFDMITIVDEHEECDDDADPATCETKIPLGARHVQSGNIYRAFSSVWNEEDKQMDVKREQMEDSFWKTNMPNMLNSTWE